MTKELDNIISDVFLDNISDNEVIESDSLDNIFEELSNIEDIGLSFKNSEKGISMEEETELEREIIDDISKSLGVPYSEEQRKIIRHSGKPLNIVSCAGSGKTAVLIAKMLFDQQHNGVQPYNILAITFNTKASEEIKERYIKGARNMNLRGQPEFKTFHALFLMMLKTVNKYRNVNVLSSTGKYTFKLLDIVRKPSEDSDKSTLLQDMFSFRSKLINNNISITGVDNLEQFEDSEEFSFNIDNYRSVMTKYNQLKEKDNVIDFDDMIRLIYEELVEHKNQQIIDNFQNVYKYVYIDEYQDISNIQMEIMDILIKDKNKFVSIGDDDQSSAKRYSISA